MPQLVRRYIKTSFIFLVAGLLLGGYIITEQFVAGIYPSRLLVTAHAHLLLVGFMLMLVMGVATWMFPRPARADTRYRPELAEAVYWVMTATTALRAAAEVSAGLSGASALRILIVLGGLGQLLGAGLFVVNMWWRVRMPITPHPASGLTAVAFAREAHWRRRKTKNHSIPTYCVARSAKAGPEVDLLFGARARRR